MWIRCSLIFGWILGSRNPERNQNCIENGAGNGPRFGEAASAGNKSWDAGSPPGASFGARTSTGSDMKKTNKGVNM